MTYYAIDSSPFGVRVVLCFDQAGADKILKDHNIDFELNAFDLGVAETHFISDGSESIILVIVDPKKCDHDAHFACGIVAHEAYHVVCRIFEHIGQPINTVGEEIAAYMIEHITKQLSVALGEKLSARKERRSTPKQTRKSKGWPKLQVDQQRDGSAGSDSPTEQQGVVRGAKDYNWTTISEADISILADKLTGSGSARTKKQRGR